MERIFRIEGVEYRVGITRSGAVWLDLIGGVTKKGSARRSPCKDLFWDEPNFEDVDRDDLKYLAERWLNAPCPAPDWCEGADIDEGNTVNFLDFTYLGNNWAQSTAPLTLHSGLAAHFKLVVQRQSLWCGRHVVADPRFQQHVLQQL